MTPRQPDEDLPDSAGERIRAFAILVAPVATLVLMVGLLAAILWQGEHPNSAHLEDGHPVPASMSPAAGS